MASHETPNQPSAMPAADPSKSKWAVWIPIVLSIVTALGTCGAWLWDKYETRQQAIRQRQEENARVLREESVHLLNDDLLKIQGKLEESKSIYDRLQFDEEPGWGILESYVARVRRDGNTPQNALMRKQISALVAIDKDIRPLVENYKPFSLMPEFRQQSKNFIDYSGMYIDRFETIDQFIASHEQLSKWQEFPKGFPIALQQEIAKRREMAQPAKAE